MTPLLKAADRLSLACSRLAMVMILGLIVSMLFEVVARYAFNAPTIWSYDVSYMLNGSLFILGAGWTLANNNHVRIDFLSGRLPVPLQHAGNLVFYVLLFLPALGLATYAAIGEAWSAAMSGKLESVSPWKPKVWPFYSMIALGLSALWLQSAAEAVRHAIGWRRPDAVRSPALSGAH